MFKDVRFCPILNFGLFWAPLFSRCFYPILNFGHFWASLFSRCFYPINFGPLPSSRCPGFTPPVILANFGPISTFSTVRSTFLAEEEAQNLEFLPHPKFWPFLGRPLKDVLPVPSPHSVHCLLCLPTKINNKERHWRTNNVVRVFW